MQKQQMINSLTTMTDMVPIKATTPRTKEWVLEVKGDGSDGDVEVSAVVSGCHGHISWGWDDPKSKVIVLSCCGTRLSCSYVDPRIIETAKIVAQEIVDQKNKEGKEPVAEEKKHERKEYRVHEKTKEEFIEQMEAINARWPNIPETAKILDEVKALKTEEEWQSWLICYNRGIGNTSRFY